MFLLATFTFLRIVNYYLKNELDEIGEINFVSFGTHHKTISTCIEFV